MYSNRIVGYSMDFRMMSTLAVVALDHAEALRSPVAAMFTPTKAASFGHGSSFMH